MFTVPLDTLFVSLDLEAYLPSYHLECVKLI